MKENTLYIVSQSMVKEFFSGRSCSDLRAKPQQEKRLSSKLGSSFGGVMVEDFNKKLF